MMVLVVGMKMTDDSSNDGDDNDDDDDDDGDDDDEEEVEVEVDDDNCYLSQLVVTYRPVSSMQTMLEIWSL